MAAGTQVRVQPFRRQRAAGHSGSAGRRSKELQCDCWTFVRVVHVYVNDGGQAVIGNVKEDAKV